MKIGYTAGEWSEPVRENLSRAPQNDRHSAWYLDTYHYYCYRTARARSFMENRGEMFLE